VQSAYFVVARRGKNACISLLLSTAARDLPTLAIRAARLVFAEIDLADVVINQQRLASVLEHDLADFQDVSVIRE
jgi:hypothetical protein